MSATVLLTDLDNTLYDWVDYFAPSFRAMVHALEWALNIGEDQLYDEFRNVYARHSSLEYAFSVQELASCRDLPKEEVEKLVRLAKGAFSRVREKRLRLYDGVLDTLRWAVKSGVVVVGVTNAPVENAKGRIKQLGIDGILSGLAALESPDVPNDGLELTREIAQRERAGRYLTRLSEARIFRLAPSEAKPSAAGYRKIVRELGLSLGTVYVVGDSVGKDLVPAQELGYTTVFARYGGAFRQENFETLLRITHWGQDRIETTYSASEVNPDYVIDSFSCLRKIIDPPQMELFS